MRLIVQGTPTRLLTFCFRNLFRRKVRTTLCILGVAIAATFVIAVGATTLRYTSVIKEMNVLFNGQVTVVSKDALVVQAIPISGSMMPQDSTIQKIGNVEGAGTVTPVLFVTAADVAGAVIQPVPVNFSMGIPIDKWQSILGPTPLRGNMGHFPTDESSNEAVAGPSLADQWNWTVGTEIRINDQSIRITGILDTKLAMLNRCLVMPLKLAQTVYNYPRSINIIAVKPVAGYPQSNLTQGIKHELAYVNALTEKDRNDIIEPVLEQVQTWNMGLQVVVFATSLILVLTVMVMSVSERRRDFATLDAMGAPINYIFRVVVLEVSLIGVLGAALGLLFGSLAAIVLASVYTSIPLAMFFPSILEIVPPLYMLQMFTTIVVVCCLGGIIPAINATRMRIAETLRAEY